MKKLLLGLGGVVVVATPVISTISCGSEKESNPNKKDSIWNYRYVQITYVDYSGDLHTTTLSHQQIASQYYGDTDKIDNYFVSRAVELAIADQGIYKTAITGQNTGMFKDIISWKPL